MDVAAFVQLTAHVADRYRALEALKAGAGGEQRRPFGGEAGRGGGETHALLSEALGKNAAAWLAGTLTHEDRRAALHRLAEHAAWCLRAEAQAALDDDDEPAKALFGPVSDRVAEFFARAKRFVREAVTAGALVMFGPAPMTEAERRAVDQGVAHQFGYLDGFIRETFAGTQPLDGTFAARAEMYGSAVWAEALNAERAVAAGAGGARFERRVLDASEHCDVCPELAARGWQPVGTLPPIGATPCRTRCRCFFEFREEEPEDEP